MIWVLLWGSASPANVLCGLAVGIVLVLPSPDCAAAAGASGTCSVRSPIARLVGHMLAHDGARTSC